MTTTATKPPDADELADVAAIVVSADSHAGPTLAQMREYCPKQYLDEYDAYMQDTETRRAAMRASGVTRFLDANGNLQTTGHNDIYARLRDMDADGVAAEVIYHNSANGEPIPLLSTPLGGLATVAAEQFEMAKVGYHIYNLWLADFCSVEPERHIGLAHVPSWDIDATVKEIEWARSVGLRGVNFPPPGRPGQLVYNDLAWEPFWSACEDLGMQLSTHASAGVASEMGHPGSLEIATWEGGGYMSRRAVWYLIYGQVFERHPKLNLILAEQYTGWFLPTLADLDKMYDRFAGRLFFDDRLPRPPSEYAMEHVFLGASFPSVELVQEATAQGYAGNVIWGRDYPHPEGTYQYPDNAVFPEGADETLVNRAALRYVFSAVPARERLMMAGQNGVRAYGLDGDALQEVATRIGALTTAELAVAPTGIPTVPAHCNAFTGAFALGASQS